MKTAHDCRRENLELLVLEHGSLDAIADKAGLGTTVYLSQIRNRALDTKTLKPRNMGSVMARKLEAACGKPIGWMDKDNSPSNVSSLVSPDTGYECAATEEESMLLKAFRGSTRAEQEMVLRSLKIANDQHDFSKGAVA